ncbi:MAG: tetratricopeptide repeat protein, partial [Verrucomicrobiaceae bacterium]
ALDRYLELVPGSAWGYRERALRRADKGEYELALSDTAVALELEPESPVSLHCHAKILTGLHRRTEAIEMLRRTISLDIDRTDAAVDLMDLAGDREESLDFIRFIENEMRRQVSHGEIVPVFQRLAWSWMEPEELLEKLRGFCQERPDLWQTWSARISHALRMSCPEDALEAATAMTRTFPLLPRAWMDLARVHQATDDGAKEVAATSKAFEISPAWDEAARNHADSLERNGQVKEAEQILRSSVASAPLNPANKGFLADLLRRTGRKEEAVDVLMEALRGSPFYAWGWAQLGIWMRRDGRTDEAVEFLQSISLANEHRAAWWSTAADAWMDLGRPEEAVVAVRKALDASPEDMDLRDKLAWMLCESGQVEEALSLCEPRAGEGKVTRELAGRRAWILMKSGQPVRAIES